MHYRKRRGVGGMGVENGLVLRIGPVYGGVHPPLAGGLQFAFNDIAVQIAPHNIHRPHHRIAHRRGGDEHGAVPQRHAEIAAGSGEHPLMQRFQTYVYHLLPQLLVRILHFIPSFRNRTIIYLP